MNSALAAQQAGDASIDELPTRDSYVPLESGIPPGGKAYDDPSSLLAADRRVQLALAENARADASVNLLSKRLQVLARGAQALGDCNTSLRSELESVRELLAQSQKREQLLEERLRELEVTVERTRDVAADERRFLVQEQDAFLSDLLAEHASEVRDLKRELAGAKAASTLAEPEALPIEIDVDLDRPRKREPSADYMEVTWSELTELPSNPRQR